MRSPSTQVLLASCGLSGAAAKLAVALATAKPTWRSRAMAFLHTATRLGDDVAALHFLQSEPLRRAHVQRLLEDTHDALACAMRLHNMLSTSESARAAAFDSAAQASALMIALGQDASRRGAARADDVRRNRR